MSPMMVVFVITLLSGILYNKYDENLRLESDRKSRYYNFDKSSEKNGKRSSQDERGEQNSEFLKASEDEDDFIVERISESDICIFTIVAQNQRLCRKNSKENSDRLTLLLMTCHLGKEGNKFEKCTSENSEQEFSKCISSLNAADLEIFESVKKRVMTVCQEVSQHLFMINSQRRAQVLLETAHLHSSVLTSFKDNQKLLDNITSQTLIRLQAQRLAFIKDMRMFKKYVTRNESLFIEAARAHIKLLSRHKNIFSGLEKDVNVLTEGFLQSLEGIQDNFTAFSAKIFEKHGKIMENLDRVESTADKILLQLEMIEKYGSSVTFKNALSWIIINMWRYRELIYAASFLLIYSLLRKLKMYTYIKLMLLVSAIAGILLKYEHVGLLIMALFMSFIAESFNWCFSFLLNSEITVHETSDHMLLSTKIDDDHSDGGYDRGHREISMVNVSNTALERNNTCCREDDDNEKLSNTTGKIRRRSSTLAVSLECGHYMEDTDSSAVRMQESITEDTCSRSSTLSDSSGHANGKGDNMSPRISSVIGIARDNTVDSSRQNNTPRKQSIGRDVIVPESTNLDLTEYEGRLPVTGHGESSMDVKVLNQRNSVPGNTNLDMEKHRISTRQSEKVTDLGEQSSRNSDMRRYGSFQGDIVLQRSITTCNVGRESCGNKNVQTTILYDSQVQTGPSEDVGIQTNTRCDSEVQTGPSHNMGIQTTTKDDSYVQTELNEDKGVQTRTTVDRQVQADATKNMEVQTRTRDDSQVQTDPTNDIRLRTIMRGGSHVEMDTTSDIRAQWSKNKDPTSVWSDGNLQSREQCGIRNDFGVPHEPLEIQEDTTRHSSRQSGIIVNTGDNTLLSNSRRQSRTSSPFEVLNETISDTIVGGMDINGRLRQESQISDGEGTSADFTTIQVGIQLNNRDGICGLMTLRGTPCRRRVSTGRCPHHRYFRR